MAVKPKQNDKTIRNKILSITTNTVMKTVNYLAHTMSCIKILNYHGIHGNHRK